MVATTATPTISQVIFVIFYTYILIVHYSKTSETNFVHKKCIEFVCIYIYIYTAFVFFVRTAGTPHHNILTLTIRRHTVEASLAASCFCARCTATTRLLRISCVPKHKRNKRFAAYWVSFTLLIYYYFC